PPRTAPSASAARARRTVGTGDGKGVGEGRERYDAPRDASRASGPLNALPLRRLRRRRWGLDGSGGLRGCPVAVRCRRLGGRWRHSHRGFPPGADRPPHPPEHAPPRAVARLVQRRRHRADDEDEPGEVDPEAEDEDEAEDAAEAAEPALPVAVAVDAAEVAGVEREPVLGQLEQ